MRRKSQTIGLPHRVEVVTASMDNRAFARGNVSRLPSGSQVPAWIRRYNRRRHTVHVWRAV